MCYINKVGLDWIDNYFLMCDFLTVVIDVVRLLAGVVCRDAVDLHSDQRVDDGFVFVLVDFR